MRISDWSSDVCSSDLADHPSTAAARNGAARRQHNLRNGAARGISAAVCTLAALRRLGSGGDRSLASLAQVGPYYPRAVARCQATALAPSSRAGSGSNIGIERSEEHTSELQSLMRNSYAVFCLNKKTTK